MFIGLSNNGNGVGEGTMEKKSREGNHLCNNGNRAYPEWNTVPTEPHHKHLLAAETARAKQAFTTAALRMTLSQEVIFC